MKLPDEGRAPDAVLAALRGYRAHDLDWRSGNTFAYVYDPGPEIEALGKAAYVDYLAENGLDPTAFPSVMRLENELVAIGAAHLRGGPGVAGNFTTGGTESITLAVKTARDRARALHPHITRPNLVLPVTAHAAFHKAAWLLGLEVRTVDVDPESYRAGPGDLAPAIDDQTVLLAASAPSYAHGVVDDVPGIGALAEERGLLLHVDACMGGWMLPLWRELGEPVPDFDFSVPGVTSISMDLHKYAFCPKGASLILHRDKSLRQHQIYACSGWTGYTVINSTLLSTRTGGPLAAAWAVMHGLGRRGYLALAQRTLGGTRALLAGLAEVEGLSVMGRPDFCLVAAEGVGGLNVFHVADEMKQRGWYIQPQLGLRGYRANVHFSIAPATGARVPEMLTDLHEAVAAARLLPDDDVAAQAGAALAALDTERLSPEGFGQLLAMAGIDGMALPERMAAINAILEALPPALADQLLVAYFNELNHLG